MAPGKAISSCAAIPHGTVWVNERKIEKGPSLSVENVVVGAVGGSRRGAETDQQIKLVSFPRPLLLCCR